MEKILEVIDAHHERNERQPSGAAHARAEHSATQPKGQR
jgi:hypothetical protein